jgi:hypothetical protein
MTFRARHLYACVCANVMLLCALTSARAADNSASMRDVPSGLYVQAIGKQTGSWQSNPLLLLNGAQELYGSITSPELIVTSGTPTTKLSADTIVNVNRFNISGFDSEDVHSTINLKRQMLAWGGGVDVRTDYDTTRTSELSTFGLNLMGIRHTGFQIAPQISYAVTAVDTLSLAASGQISRYDSTSFNDYNIYTVTPSYSHSFDPRNAATFSVQLQRYKTVTGTSTAYDTIAPSVGWDATLTPRLTIRAAGGFQTVKQYRGGAAVSDWTVEYTYSGDLVYKGVQDALDLSFTRAQYPFANSTQSLLTSFGLRESHNINERFTASVGGNYQYGTYPTTATGSLDTIISANAALTYHATTHLDITAGYGYRHQTLIDVRGSPQDHSGTLSLTYHPQAWAL